MKYIDIHAHLNFAAFDVDRDAVIGRTLKNNVSVINIGTQINTSTDAVLLAEKYDHMFAFVGLHPIHVNKSFHDEMEIGPETKPFESRDADFDRSRFLNLMNSKKVVGVGECGLDFFRIVGDVEHYKTRQIENFKKQIEFALEFDKPLMIHCRDAYKEVFEILSGYKKMPLAGKDGEKLRGNIHFFAGSIDDARKFLDIGFDISFTGVITFAPQYRELVEFVPIERIHAETDCPYVAPVPNRGRRNEPAFVIDTVNKMAEIKGVSVQKMSEQLIVNAKRLFNLPF